MDSLREAMYELIETREASEIKVVDLIRKAGVSRGGFYRNFHLVTDVLKDDIKEVSDDGIKLNKPLTERFENTKYVKTMEYDW